VVLRREGDRRVSLDDARTFASAMRAPLVTLPGEDHLAFAGGGADVVEQLVALAQTLRRA
jgi:hypothetical protein